MRWLTIVFALAAAAAAPDAPGFAQAQASRDCRDDSGTDRCAAEQQRRVRELFGVPAIEALRDAGSQVRRAFYVDGYGRDLIALTFIRAPGQDPKVILNWPRRAGTPPRAPAEMLLSKAAWEDVLARSAYFDRSFEKPAADPNTASICLHAWVYTVEAAEPDRGRGAPGGIRRKVDDACGGGLAQAYANDMAKVGLAALPYCAALDPEQHRNPASMLRACEMLEGDRIAAAEAYNQAMRLRDTYLPRAQVAALDVFHQRGTLDWQGQRGGGERGDADDLWVARRQAAGGSFFITRAIGESATRVRVEGFLTGARKEGDREIALRAPVTFRFAPDPGKRLLAIQEALVGPFAETGD